MKKFLLASLAALALAGSAMAQPAQAAGQNPPVTITISGNLELIQGVIGLKANGTSYYVPRLWRLVGFVKEVQEGAAVKLEGYAYPIPSQPGYAFFAVTKLSIAGKDYDLGQVGPFGGKFGRGMRGGMMGGRGWDDEGPRGMMGGPRW
jgi:hypothetical protein